MLYNKEEKQKLEEVISILKEYIADNPFADLIRVCVFMYKLSAERN